MAKYFRSPNANIKLTRVKEGKTVESLETVLLDKIDEIIKKKIPLTKTKLSRETKIGGNSFKTYAAIFDDTIEMLRMFELGTKDRTGALANVPDFDKLEDLTTRLIREHIYKIDDLFGVGEEIRDIAPDDSNIYSRNEQQIDSIVEMFWYYLGETPLIHEAFIGANSLDDIDRLIEEKYEYNQSLRKKLSQLEKQVAKEQRLSEG